MDKKTLAIKVDQFEVELKRVGRLIESLNQIRSSDFNNRSDQKKKQPLLDALEKLHSQNSRLQNSYLEVRCELFASAFGR